MGEFEYVQAHVTSVASPIKTDPGLTENETISGETGSFAYPTTTSSQETETSATKAKAKTQILLFMNFLPLFFSLCLEILCFGERQLSVFLRSLIHAAASSISPFTNLTPY
ncbi:MAG: hypothetical protein A2289_13625 [Deltaproteobacteria bacterium RIFOXYA12_FULL_58_15]|nr:MAG: hypothetical protein A2289_13625 [Deltaproteobacteria bacterium RIFOXYA12_FULL_58_15]